MALQSKFKHPCRYCDKIFLDDWARDIHAEDAHPNDPPVSDVIGDAVEDEFRREYRCNICLITVSHRTTLWTHKKSHDNRFPCTLCSTESEVVGFRTMRGLAYHNRLFHPKDNLLICTHCPGVILRGRAAKQEHIKATHTHKCRTCWKTFGLKEQLTRHIKIHNRHPRSPQKEIKVEDESAEGSPKDAATTNGSEARISRESAYDSRFKCDICSLTLSGKISLKEHKETHSEQFPCPICTTDTKVVGFRSIVALGNHQRHFHPDALFLTCSKCPALVFQTRVAKSAHVRRVHVHNCPTCKKVFGRREHLISHQRKHVKPTLAKAKAQALTIFKCKECSLIFSNKNLLMNHALNAHEGKGLPSGTLFKCSVCLKTGFPSLEDLMKHMKEHHEVGTLKKPVLWNNRTPVGATTAKPTGNPPAPKAAATKPQILSTSTPELIEIDDEDPLQIGQGPSSSSSKSHKCPTCSKIFKSDHVLQRHLRSHERAKPGKRVNQEESEEDSCSDDPTPGNADSDFEFEEPHVLNPQDPFEHPSRPQKRGRVQVVEEDPLALDLDEPDQVSRAFPCVLCSTRRKSVTFNSHSGLISHNRTVHPKEDLFVCQLCPGVLLRGRAARDKHTAALHIFMCQLCSKLFKSEEELQNHSRTYHKNSKSGLRLGEDTLNDDELPSEEETHFELEEPQMVDSEDPIDEILPDMIDDNEPDIKNIVIEPSSLWLSPEGDAGQEFELEVKEEPEDEIEDLTNI